MEKYYDVMHRILELLPTIEEGIDRVKIQLNELRIEESTILLKDIVEGICRIESAIEPIDLDEEVKNLQKELTEILEQTTCLYENKQVSILNDKIDILSLKYKNWKNKLEVEINKYVIS